MTVPVPVPVPVPAEKKESGGFFGYLGSLFGSTDTSSSANAAVGGRRQTRKGRKDSCRKGRKNSRRNHRK